MPKRKFNSRRRNRTSSFRRRRLSNASFKRIRRGTGTKLKSKVRRIVRRFYRKRRSARFTARVKKALAPITRTRIYHSYTTGILTQTAGLQNVQQHGILSAADLRAINTSLAAEVPNIILTSSQWLDFKKVDSWVQYRNACNNTVQLTCYHLIARRDADNTAGSPTEFLSTPIDAFVQGLNNQGMGASFFSNVGVTPYESNDFTRLYKVVRVQKKTLAPNNWTTFRMKSKNVRVGFNDFQDIQSVQIAKKSKSLLVVAHTIATLNSAGNNANTSLFKLGIVQKEKYVLRNSQDFMSDKQLSVALGAINTNASIIIDDQVGAPTTVANAA